METGGAFTIQNQDKVAKGIVLNILMLVLVIALTIFFFTAFRTNRLLGWLVLILFFAAIAGWIYMDYVLYVRKPETKVIKKGDLKTPAEYRQILETMDPKIFGAQIRRAIEQLDRMEARTKTVDQALKNAFGDSVISYDRYNGTIREVREIFYDNLQAVINRIMFFDEEGYAGMISRGEQHTDAFIPYQETEDDISRRLQDNETILRRLDALLLEITKLNENHEPLENLDEMQQLNDLIHQTKLYR